jgi:hypothetical protein
MYSGRNNSLGGLSAVIQKSSKILGRPGFMPNISVPDININFEKDKSKVASAANRRRELGQIGAGKRRKNKNPKGLSSVVKTTKTKAKKTIQTKAKATNKSKAKSAKSKVKTDIKRKAQVSKVPKKSTASTPLKITQDYTVPDSII